MNSPLVILIWSINIIEKVTFQSLVRMQKGKIVGLYQIKHHNGTKLTYNEIEQFINKKILAKKVLILNDCIIDKKIEILLTEKNIQLT